MCGASTLSHLMLTQFSPLFDRQWTANEYFVDTVLGPINEQAHSTCNTHPQGTHIYTLPGLHDPARQDRGAGEPMGQ